MDLNRTRKLAGIELTRPGLVESHVADTIVQQMGGFGRLKAMLGAKVMKLADGMGIGIRWPNKERSRGNYVEVRLEPSDTYTMEFFNVSGSSKKSVKKYDDVYFDSLVEIFEKQTGWFLSLGGSKKPVGSGRAASPELPPAGTKHEGRKKLDDLRALLGEAVAPKNVREVKALISKLGLKTAEVRKTARSFEVEISDEDEKQQFTKAIGDEWGGYTTGYGAVVLSPTHQSKGDWNDPTSRWHY